MSKRETRQERVERVLQAAYRRTDLLASGPMGGEPSEAAVGRIMTRVRVAARERRDGAPGDARFLWRFVSAGTVAAAALLLVAITDLPQEIGASNLPADDLVASVLNPTMPF
jgi:hypothetical protein